MKIKRQEGTTLDFTAAAAHTSGQFLLLEEVLGVVQDDVANGAAGILVVEGVFDAPCKSADTWNPGQALYWDDTAKEFTITATANFHRGYAWATKGAGVTTSPVKLVHGKDVAG